MEELKVGQSFEVVKVVSSGYYSEGAFIEGTYRGAFYKKGDPYPFISVLSNKDHTFRIMYLESEVKLFGRFTITKLK